MAFSPVKNTLILNIRQLFNLIVGLYTIRIVLNTLGTADYGIYNLIVGITTAFGILSGAMAVASQRYFSLEIGRNDNAQLKRIFSLNILLYLFIGIISLLLAETAGLWFVHNKLNVPLERKASSVFIYHIHLVSLFFAIFSVPYKEYIISIGAFNIYTLISFIDALLKLIFVFMLRFIPYDKLQLHGILMAIVSFIDSMIYVIFCIIKHRDCRFKFFWNKSLMKEIIDYMLWNLFGSSISLFKNQIINVLLMQFYGPIVVASRGIATTVNNTASVISYNCAAVIRPQIIKDYAVKKIPEMLLLVFRSAKGFYYLLYAISLPLMLEIPVILLFWLKNPPEYAVLFIRLILIDSLITLLGLPFEMALNATGKIKLFKIVTGGVLLSNLPLSWVALLLGLPMVSIMIISIFLSFSTFILQLFLLKQQIKYSIFDFIKNTLFPVIVVSIVSIIAPLIAHYILAGNIYFTLLKMVIGVTSVIICIYIFGITADEKTFIKKKILAFKEGINAR